ncbi:MAG: pyrroline-5-carboxylate reductase [Candidatus Atribacteria bacterium]|nr:pyrroline-5-carboxylate reductase [Candidatus Atribacteria bacterium]
MKDSILFIGCGHMGSALVKGLYRDKLHQKFDFLLYDVISERAEQLALEVQGQVVNDFSLPSEPRYVFLAVKPKDLKEAAASLPQFSSAIFISLAAGITGETLQNILPGRSKLVRIMPNLCVEVGEGVIAVAFISQMEAEDKEDLLFLLSSLGWVFEAKEEELDLLTALSGSGPGLVSVFIEALADGGVGVGIPWDKSLKAVLQTVLGTAYLLKEKRIHPGLFKNQVASPGGTTISGIQALEKRAFRNAVMEAIEAARKRAKELST